MKIGGVDFPRPLLEALQKGHLVVFAGAGVSMGPPAKLPDFKRLAGQLATDTGHPRKKGEPVDRFLGRLKIKGVEVHQQVAKILQRDGLEPTDLHRNLLRLYGPPDGVRIATTNFDLLFEQSAAELFPSATPRVFQAPALPLGSRFRGIVHLHGSVDEPDEMVLTHLDFGHAYLTESDGWARRFLVDLFANNTVLFVGYSHNDTIMTYLTPSLPPAGDHWRFALIGERRKERDHWHRMGVVPIEFPQEDADDFSGLDIVVDKLAKHAQRTILEWRQLISTVAGGRPPIVDDENASIVNHAMSAPELTRFFTEAAKRPEWIEWLRQQGHLDCLFTYGETTQQVAELALWLAEEFAIAHPDAVLALLEQYRGNISVKLWHQLARSVGNREASTLMDTATVSKWVHFLTTSMPPRVHEYTIEFLSELAETSSRLGALQSLLQLYDAMAKPSHEVRPIQEYSNYATKYQHYLKEFWNKSLQPNLEHMAWTLLERTTERLAERYSSAAAWATLYQGIDPDSFGRSAIEPHRQDEHNQGSVNTLIDIARECLEWLAANDPEYVGSWCNRFSSSEVPLLRRLAIHAMSTRDDLSPDHKINWLLERCDLNELAARHEIFQAAKAAYPQASPHRRADFIEAVSGGPST